MSEPSYGKGRKKRLDVSYGQIEAAATAILETGVRPTVQGVRDSLQGGSPLTVLAGLNRFWGEIGGRLAGVPDSRRRLPAAVADLADTLWHTALDLATDAADGADAGLRAQLGQLRTETETRGHALAQREIEIDALVRSRERTIRELEEHLRTTMALVTKRDSTIRSLESRLAAAMAEAEAYRQRLAGVVTRAVAAHRRPTGSAAQHRSTAHSTRSRREAVPRAKRNANSKKPRAAAKTSRRRNLTKPRTP